MSPCCSAGCLSRIVDVVQVHPLGLRKWRSLLRLNCDIFLKIPAQGAAASLGDLRATRSPALSEHKGGAPDESWSAGAGGWPELWSCL